MNGSYDAGLVVLSIAVAVLASYVALDLASRVTANAGAAVRYWLVGGALSMGLGIWSMHFIGMLAFRLPMAMSYDTGITVFSLLIAVLVSGFALYTVSRERLGAARLLLGGALMGVGIAAMHYTDMAAMRMDAPIRYRPDLFAASIAVAVVASLAALWIAFRLRQESLLSGFWRKAGSALVMGGAICGMHYTGMAAAIFPSHLMAHGAPAGLGGTWLAAAVAAFSILMLATTLLLSLFDARRARSLAEHLSHSAELARINASLAAEIVDRKRAEQQLVELAHFDPLTGLPNRRQFHASLRQAIALAEARGWQVPVLFLDLDQFKSINDTLGHVVGDELLRQVGQRLMSCLRMRDTVGRLGGDEFGIILTTPEDANLAGEIANKVNLALRRPYLLDEREVTVTTSIGITVYPTDSTDIDCLIRYADTAMYEAKAAGRDTWRFYTEQMNQRALQRLDLNNALRGALQRDEFVLHYQPKIDLRSGRCTGVEALLRWERPDVGLVYPDAFIPALEENGLITQVGKWVIEQACLQFALWRQAGILLPGVAVNVSARQMVRGSMVQANDPGEPGAELPELQSAIAGSMQRHGLEPGQFEVELTESTLMANAQANVRLLGQLQCEGVRVSVDDFGTGYSSLAYLKRFPIDTVKIDRDFIRDLPGDVEDEAIVLAIVSLAHSLGLRVVAEGVETFEQSEFLRAHGCDEAQGYHFARPMPANRVAQWLAERRPDSPVTSLA